MLLDVQHTLKKLKTYSNSTYPILSVYLEVPPRNHVAHSLSPQFNHIIHEHIVPTHLPTIQEDVLYIDAFLKEYHPHHNTRGIALFSGDNQLWEVITTVFPLPNLAILCHEPYLLPIYKKMQEYQRSLVILADREKALLLTLYLGVIESKEFIDDPDVPQKVRAQGSPELQSRISRHIQDHLHRHFKLISNKVQHFIQRKQFSNVIIGGHREIIPTIKEHLPQEVKNKVIGEFSAEPDMNINEIIERCKILLNNMEKAIPSASQDFTFSP